MHYSFIVISRMCRSFIGKSPPARGVWWRIGRILGVTRSKQKLCVHAESDTRMTIRRMKHHGKILGNR